MSESVQQIIRRVLDWPEERDPDGAVKDALNEIAREVASLLDAARREAAAQEREAAARYFDERAAKADRYGYPGRAEEHREVAATIRARGGA